ncbi:MAG: twin-arginine translocase TatA/TatE family subunit [Chloroflexota bacterium]
MNILGIGTLEIVIILVIIFLVLGPEDLEKTGRTIGKWINKVTRSEGWSAVRSISREVRGLPSRLAREAELDKLKDELDPNQLIGEVPDLGIPDLKAKPEPAASKPAQAASEEPKPSPPDEKPNDKEKDQ